VGRRAHPWSVKATAGALVAAALLTRRPGRADQSDRADQPDQSDRADPVEPGAGRRAVAIVRTTARSAADDRITGLAAEVAFFGVLAMFPALIAVAAVVGSLDVLVDRSVEDDVRRQVLEWLETFLTAEASGVIEAVDTLFRENNGGTFTIAFLAAAFAASRGTNALMRALAIVHGRPDARSFVRRRLVAFVLIVATVVAIAAVTAAFVVGPLLGRGRDIADSLGLGSAFVTFWQWFRVPAVFLAVVAWAALVLHLAPDGHGRWRFDLPGALLAGVLWLVATGGLQLYLSVAGGTNEIFGILGGILVVLLWLYLLSAALLVGAEFNAALVHHTGARP
jgi:membrane protein